jgi:formyltetrahydrofolate deformylase
MTSSASAAGDPLADFVLRLDCPDRPGIVHAVTGWLGEHGGNIVESQQFGDALVRRFFMRIGFTVDRPTVADELRSDFARVAEPFGMEFELWNSAAPYRTLIMVSKHRDAEPLVRSHGLEFHHIPVTPETKVAAEKELVGLVDDLGVHLVVLARYMQVLSDDTCRSLSGRAINIHHSFLPSFKGARPYHQAFDRGVKLVGATAHYVTADLDEGPIIEQDVVRVDHASSQDALVAAGRDVEAQVLARAVGWHSQSRVMLNGHRTVVFR